MGQSSFAQTQEGNREGVSLRRNLDSRWARSRSITYGVVDRKAAARSPRPGYWSAPGGARVVNGCRSELRSHQVGCDVVDVDEIPEGWMR